MRRFLLLTNCYQIFHCLYNEWNNGYKIFETWLIKLNFWRSYGIYRAIIIDIINDNLHFSIKETNTIYAQSKLWLTLWYLQVTLLETLRNFLCGFGTTGDWPTEGLTRLNTVSLFPTTFSTVHGLNLLRLLFQTLSVEH